MKLSAVFKYIVEQAKEQEFLPTGFKALDDGLDGGFLRKELIVLGAGTGQGKSYFAGQIMSSIAKKGFKSAYFSLEITNSMIASRLVGATANIKPTRLTNGFLTPKEIQAKQESEAELLVFEDFIELYDDIYFLEEIISEIEAKQYEFVVIDFAQNIEVKGATEEYSRLSKISSDLQKAAKKNNCCILLLSQLSNTVAREGSSGKTIEYKGSGGIATATDLGFILERQEYLPGAAFQEVKLILKKNRRGISGLEFDLKFKHPGGMIYEA